MPTSIILLLSTTYKVDAEVGFTNCFTTTFCRTPDTLDPTFTDAITDSRRRAEEFKEIMPFSSPNFDYVHPYCWIDTELEACKAIV